MRASSSAKGQPYLHAREAGAEADVGAEAESHVAVGRAGNIEAEGIVEHGRIAIGRHLPVGDLVAGLDGMALVAHVARCRAALVDRGRGPAQDLVDGGAHLGNASLTQGIELLGILHQGLQAAADGAPRGLGAGGKQQHEEIEQLIVGERSTRAAVLLRLEPRLDDRRQDVVGQVVALAGDQAGAVVAQLLRVLSGNDLGRRRGDARIDPLGELGTVLLRHAEQQADRLQRQIAGEAGDEIERLVLGQGIDQGHRAAAQLHLQRMDGAIGEALVDEAAQPLVAGIVGPIEELAGLVLVLEGGAAGDAAAALVGGERDRIEHDGHGILVPAHHPEPLPIGAHGRWLVPVDGRVLARPGEVIVREALGERGVVRQVDAGGLSRLSAHARLR